LLLYFLQKSCRRDLRFSWVLSTSFHLLSLTNVLFNGCSAGGKYNPLSWLKGDSLIFCWSDKEAPSTLKGSALPCQCLPPKMAISWLLKTERVLLLHAVLDVPRGVSV
ncbi:hypothetical protein N325_03982, partial [Colius striatus]